MTEAAVQQEREVKLFPKQFDAATFSTQFGAAVAGVQSGKTFLGAHWAGTKIGEFPDKNGIIVAPTYKILNAATLKKFFEVFPEFRAYYKEQKGEITLPTGGTVYIRSADNPLGIEGITAHWVWLDEGGMASPLTWTVLRSRVSMTGGQILITTTPYNMGWLYTDFYMPWKERRDTNLSFFTWASVENPNFSPEFYRAEENRLPPEEFARRYKGEFQKMTGLVWDIPAEQIIAPIDSLAAKATVRIMGVDWGFRNPAAIVVWAQYDNTWYAIAEWKAAEKTTDEIAQVIQNLVKEYRITKVYPDPAEPDRVEELHTRSIPVYEANKHVVDGINFVRELIYQKRLFIFNTCTDLLDEVSMYHYPETKAGQDNKPPKEEPEKFNDHLCDASRYALYSYQPVVFNIPKPSPPIKMYYPELGF